MTRPFRPGQLPTRTERAHDESVVYVEPSAVEVDPLQADVVEGEPVGELYTSYNPLEISAADGEPARSEVTVELVNKRLINGDTDPAASSGYFGRVYAVDVRFPKKPGETYPFALKEFTKDDAQARAEAQAAIAKHRMAKRAGLKVWKTYRLGKDEKSILMTTADPKEWKVIGSSNTLEAAERDEFLPIHDYETFLVNYYEQASKATEKGILIKGDVPMFFVNKDKLDFILGDFDRLDESSMPQADLLRENLHYLHGALYTFLSKNVGPDSARPYVQQASDFINSAFHQTVELGPKYLP